VLLTEGDRRHTLSLQVLSTVVNQVRRSESVVHNYRPLCWRRQGRTGGGPASFHTAIFVCCQWHSLQLTVLLYLPIRIMRYVCVGYRPLYALQKKFKLHFFRPSLLFLLKWQHFQCEVNYLATYHHRELKCWNIKLHFQNICARFNQLLIENRPFSPFLPTPVSIEALAYGFLWDLSCESLYQKLRVPGLPPVKTAWSYGRLVAVNTSVWQTDGRTSRL